MPQLSPMMGFITFLFVLAFYYVFFCGISKSSSKIKNTKMKMAKKSSIKIFSLWNGSINA
uniref:ATP synthase F0 subunit 8 n=1 Tax=Pleurobranchaea sp. TY-2016 TaxID=1883447 RepID=A0A1C9M3K9_9GAST|nr:ATP synthase F0 subunit 8 [Pleurobranchaea sp. TY-2016]